jgi:DNA mismatch repair protein PMS2
VRKDTIFMLINFNFQCFSDENQSLNSSIQSQDEEKSISISCKTMTVPNTLKFEMKTPAKVNVSTIMNEIANESGYDLESQKIETMEKEFLEISQEQSEDGNSSDDEVVEVDVSRTKNPFKQYLKLSIDKIAADAEAEEEMQERLNEQAKHKSYRLRFKEKIDPSKNKKAEVELETEIKKDMFSHMEVLGQFNLGFIIAKLESDLFIVDQHASDERYNFEKLQNSLKIDSQKMIMPEKLELTAIQEDVIIENLKVFEMNGFKFEIDEHGEATKRIKLTSRPYSKNWEFGREDIEEMVFALQESPTTIVRPSKIRTMLASRACRKSVMIGDALTKNQMKKLLTHMGEIDHCWQCPHGRPTIRFLQNVDFINDQNSS